MRPHPLHSLSSELKSQHGTLPMLTENIGAKVGLALSQALIVTGMLQYGLLRATEVVSQMTSVERVLDYTNIEKEPDLESAPGKYCNSYNLYWSRDLMIRGPACV